jgi:very-short-patch-repair endonuclease
MGEYHQRRKELRQAATDAELRLWKHLRAHRFSELKFRRQHPIGSYIVDFYCHQKSLVIEVDGSQHYENGGLAYDRERTAFLEAQGLRVLRFTNVEVLTETDGVLATIWEEAVERTDRSPPSP